MNKSSGMTLVELLVAMVVGLILLGGVYVSFVSSTTTNSMNEQLSRMQENGRFAMDVLTRDIRMAGYRGCLGSGVNVDNFLDDTTYAYDFGVAMGGFDFDEGTSGWLPALPLTTESGSIANSSPMAGSDILVMRSLVAGEITITTTMPSTAAVFFIPPNTTAVQKCDVLMVADCTNQTAAVFLATDHNLGNGNVIHNTGANPACSHGLENDAHAFNYGAGAELFHVQSVTYFVRDTDAGGNPTEPTLYRRVGVENPEPLVEGVENMQIRYGEDTIGNDRAADIYVTADAVTDWNNVVSARVGLLLRSPNDLLRGDIDTATYDVNDTDIDAPGDDRRLRMVMSTTTGIRNRLR